MKKSTVRQLLFINSDIYSQSSELIGNFDNYSSNSIVSDDEDRNILHTKSKLGINVHPNKQ